MHGSDKEKVGSLRGNQFNSSFTGRFNPGWNICRPDWRSALYLFRLPIGNADPSFCSLPHPLLSNAPQRRLDSFLLKSFSLTEYGVHLPQGIAFFPVFVCIVGLSSFS